jgi:hypothetical protein
LQANTSIKPNPLHDGEKLAGWPHYCAQVPTLKPAVFCVGIVSLRRRSWFLIAASQVAAHVEHNFYKDDAE